MLTPQQEEMLVQMLTPLCANDGTRSIELEDGMNFLLALHTSSTFMVLHQMDLSEKPGYSFDQYPDKDKILKLLLQLERHTRTTMNTLIPELLKLRGKQKADNFLATILNKETH